MLSTPRAKSVHAAVMPRRLHHDRALDAVARALARTALSERKSMVRTEIFSAGNCLNPWKGEIHARPSPRETRKGYDPMVTVRPGSKIPVILNVTGRCRQCVPCKRAHARAWATRAMEETVKSERTWFVSLTLSPEYEFRLQSQTRLHLASGGTDLEALSDRDQFSEIAKFAYGDCQKYLKRVRKEAKGRLRFILVVERGSDPRYTERMHYHLLVHECDRGDAVYRKDTGAVSKEVLERQWRKYTQGSITHARLCKRDTPRDIAKAAWYVCKYIPKAPLARVRASKRYARPQPGRDGSGPTGPQGTTVPPTYPGSAWPSGRPMGRRE